MNLFSSVLIFALLATSSFQMALEAEEKIRTVGEQCSSLNIVIKKQRAQLRLQFEYIRNLKNSNESLKKQLKEMQGKLSEYEGDYSRQFNSVKSEKEKLKVQIDHLNQKLQIQIEENRKQKRECDEKDNLVHQLRIESESITVKCSKEISSIKSNCAKKAAALEKMVKSARANNQKILVGMSNEE